MPLYGKGLAGVMMATLALGANPAWAGMRAHYLRVASQGTPTRYEMDIAIDDAGNTRIDLSKDGVSVGAIIEQKGVAYIVGKGKAGWFVARQADFVAMERGSATGKPAEGTGSPSRYEIVDLGPQAVGGRPGEVYGVRDRNGDARADLIRRYVISSDPALAPLGRAIAREMAAVESARTGESALDDAAMQRAIVLILSKGTVLRNDDGTILDAIVTADVPLTTFDLPGPVLSLDQLRAALTPPVPTIALPKLRGAPAPPGKP